MPTPKGKVIINGLPVPKGTAVFPYDYNFTRNKSVAETYESLASQATGQYGLDVIWMPLAARTDITLRDNVLGEMANKDYHSSHYLRVMMQDIQQLKGGENIYSKFGLIIEDTLTVFVTVKDFIERVGQTAIHSDSIHKIWDKTDEVYCKPEIQDIIYVPMYDGFYEVNFAERYEHMAIGYSYGWMVYLKKFKYSTSDNVYIDKTQTGVLGQTGEHPDYEKIIDSINSSDVNVGRDQKANPILDPTQTGFDPASTPDIENDDISKNAIPVKKPGEKDLFNGW